MAGPRSFQDLLDSSALVLKLGLELGLEMGSDESSGQVLVGMVRVSERGWVILYAYESPYRDRSTSGVCVCTYLKMRNQLCISLVKTF